MIRSSVFGERRENIKKQLNILIQLAKIDGDYDQREKEFIHDFGKAHQLDRSTIKEIENNPDYYIDVKAFTVDEKIEVLYNALYLAKVDRRILPNEIVYCQKIATSLGFRRSLIDFMLPLVTNQPLETVNYSAIRRKIAPFI
jgi:hypothetical protein